MVRLNPNKDSSEAYEKLIHKLFEQKFSGVYLGKQTRQISFNTEYGIVDLLELDFFCMDCKDKDSPTFMVFDEIWKEAGFNDNKGNICILCFEKRLNRKLRIQDFTQVPCNDLIFFGFSL